MLFAEIFKFPKVSKPHSATAYGEMATWFHEMLYYKKITVFKVLSRLLTHTMDAL